MEKLQTKDGSFTLVQPLLNETYHSRNGAINESAHVFINAGLAFRLSHKSHLHVLEVGFGTGLNALMTLQYLWQRHYMVHYTGLEPFGLEYHTVEKLQLVENLYAEHLRSHFERMHLCEWEQTEVFCPNFSFLKSKSPLQDFSNAPKYDLVYFDAFAPNVQPELWTEEALAHLYSLMSEEAVLVTYCAKGQFKRALKVVGFEIEALPGPPGKREMTRAIKKASH